MRKSVLLLVLLMVCAVSNGKKYTRCGLTQELLNQRFPRSFIGNWVCMIESESQKDTSKVTSKANGSKSLGLFQINSRDWCTFQRPGGKCNVKCEDLTNEDLSDDSVCAKKIMNEIGLKAWDGWKRSCYDRTLPIPNC